MQGIKKWYRVNIEWSNGHSNSSPAGKELKKAVSLFECKSLENKKELSNGSIHKMNLTEYIVTNGGTYADVINVIRWKKTK